MCQVYFEDTYPYPCVLGSVTDMLRYLEKAVPNIERGIVECADANLRCQYDDLEGWTRNEVRKMHRNNFETRLQRLLGEPDSEVERYGFADKAAVASMLARVRIILKWPLPDASLAILAARTETHVVHAGSQAVVIGPIE